MIRFKVSSRLNCLLKGLIRMNKENNKKIKSRKWIEEAYQYLYSLNMFVHLIKPNGNINNLSVYWLVLVKYSFD